MKEVKRMTQIYGQVGNSCNKCDINPPFYLLGTLYTESLQTNKLIIKQRKHSTGRMAYGR